VRSLAGTQDRKTRWSGFIEFGWFEPQWGDSIYVSGIIKSPENIVNFFTSRVKLSVETNC